MSDKAGLVESIAALEAENKRLSELLDAPPYVDCICAGCPRKVPQAWASGLCEPCAAEDCEHADGAKSRIAALEAENRDLRAKLEAAEQLRETMDSAVVIYAKERDEAKTDNARLLEALYGYEEAFVLPAGAGDALDRMCPSGWHHVDIVVRLGGKEHHWQGDWLKNVWYARKFARAILNPADEEAAMLRSALTKLAELNPAYAESVSCKRCGKIDAVTHGIDTSNPCRCPRVVTEGPRPPGPTDEVSAPVLPLDQRPCHCDHADLAAAATRLRTCPVHGGMRFPEEG